MAWIGKEIETIGSILSGSQNAGVEAARIAAESNEKREQRDHEINQLIMKTTQEQLRQVQENLRESNKSFMDTLKSMRLTAREAEDAQRRQLAELIKEQSEKAKDMTEATIIELQAMRQEFIEARKEKEEEIRRTCEENQALINETMRQHYKKINEIQEEVKKLNEQQLETVPECSKMMLEQAEKQRKDMNEAIELRLRDQRENAEKIDASILHDREIGLTRGFAAATINMANSKANSKENATIVELSNSLRDSLSETRTLHQNSVDTSSIDANLISMKKEHEAELSKLRRELEVMRVNERLQNEQRKLPESHATFQSKFFKEYSIIGILGEGKFGYLFETNCVLDMNTYAVARIAINSNGNNLAKANELARELARFDHPGIVRCYSAWIETPPEGWQKWSDDNMFVHLQRDTKIAQDASAFFYATMESCTYSLEKWLEKNQSQESRSLPQMKMWFKQIVSAVEYIHRRSMILGDLKPSNILIARENVLKIYPIGIVSELIMKDEEDTSFTPIDISYLSPEQVKSSDRSSKIEIFALGLIFAELCTAMPKEDLRLVFDNYRNGVQSDVVSNVPEVEKFLAMMTNLNWAERPDCKELLNHPFLNNNVSNPRDHHTFHLQSLPESEPNMLPEEQEAIRQKAAMIEQKDSKHRPSKKHIADHGSDAHEIRKGEHYSRKRRTAIGIDLGTTFTCVAYMSNDREVEVASNHHGNRITPSVVHYGSDITLVGENAEAMRGGDNINTIFNVKRLMGRTADDVEIKMMKFPFEIIPSRKGNANVRVYPTNYGKAGKEIVFCPEQICADLLRHMKIIAEKSIGEEVTEAVISVPAHFNNAQRQATKDAGEIAGLKVLRIVNEPTAAALAYGFEMRRHEDSRTVLVYDLGGGKFDASIVKISGANVEVLSTRGLNSVGGHDFDCRMYEEAIERFREMEVDVDEDRQFGLLQSCELEKKTLSMMKTAKIEVFNREARRNCFTLTRQTFEEICEDLFEKTICLVEEAIKDSGCKMSEIDDVLLIGGSSRIPRVQELLMNLFGHKIKFDIAPDHAIACGAAVLAASLTEDEEVKLVDVTPRSLGLGINNHMCILVPANSRLPIINKNIYTNACDNETSLICEVYEGESPYTSQNTFLAKVTVACPPKPKNGNSIEIAFSIDADGMLHVSAKDMFSGKEAETILETNSLSLAERNQMRISAKKRAEQQAIEQAKTEARTAFADELMRAKRILHRTADEGKREEIRRIVMREEEWFEKGNPSNEELYRHVKTIQDELSQCTTRPDCEIE